jgi:hypothetical protein
MSTFGCMEEYNIPNKTKSNVEMLEAMKKCLKQLKSKKCIRMLSREIDLVNASLRVAQFAFHFNSFKGEKVHAGPAIRTPEGNCRCEGYTHVIHAGCHDCCISWPDIHVCDCEELLSVDCRKGEYRPGGCLHPGEWDSQTVLETQSEHNLCLICVKFETLETICAHGPLLIDLFLLEAREVYNSCDDYATSLTSLLERDSREKKSEAVVTSAVALIAKQRKATMPLKRKVCVAGV